MAKLIKDFEINNISFTATFEIDNSFVDSTGQLMKIRLKACHTNKNLNGSYISKDTMQDALPSFANKPILASIIQITNDDGSISYDFNGHDMELIDDPWNTGEQRINYIEKVVGVIPETNNIELVEEDDKYYVYVDGFIYTEYGNGAAEILQERGESSVSVELSVNDYSYNAKEKYLTINSFDFCGIALLGAHVKAGMQGAKGTPIQFEKISKENQEEQMITIMTELNKTLSNFNILNLSKGGNELNKFNELLNIYGKTEADIEFDYDGLTDEELEAKFKEVYSETQETPADFTESTDNVEEIKTENPEVKHDFSKIFTVDEFGNTTVSFEISHEDIRSALYQLISQYDELDDDWYFVDCVYDTYFEFMNWSGNKVYRQNYKRDGDNISFEGERIELYPVRLTATEKAALDEMRSNYSALLEFKTKADEEVVNIERDKIFNLEVYSVLQENEAFNKLKTEASKYTIQDLDKQCKVIFAEYILSQKQSSEPNQDEIKKVNKINFNVQATVEKKPYGDLFDDNKTK